MSVLALLWGSTFLWIKIALEGFSPVQVTMVRCVLASATLLALCVRRGLRLPRGRGMWTRLFVAGFFCNALPFGLFSIGERSVDSGVAGVLNATTPLWTVLIGLLAGTERRVPAGRLAGLLLGFAGVVVIFEPWRHAGGVGWGALAIVGAAASYAVGFAVMGRTLVGRGVPALSLAAGQIVAATALTALTLPAGGFDAVHVSTRIVTAAVVLGVCATGVTFFLTYRIIADEGATNAATVGYLLPVVSLVLGAVLLGERIDLRVAAGMVVVLVGVGLTRRSTPAAAPGAPGSHDVPDAPVMTVRGGRG